MAEGLLGFDTEALRAFMQGFAATEEEKKAAKMQAITQLGLGLLGTPKGQELQRFGLSGLNAMNNYQANLADLPRQKATQIAGARGAMDLQQQMAQMQEAARYQEAASGYQQPISSPRSGPMAGAALPTATPAAPVGRYQQQMQFADYIEGKGMRAIADQIREKADKLKPKLKDTRTATLPDGTRITIKHYDDGTEEVSPYGPQPEKLHFGGTGAQTNVGFDPYTGKEVSAGAPATMTPGEKASNAVAQANLRLTQERAGRDRTAETAPIWDATTGSFIPKPVQGVARAPIPVPGYERADRRPTDPQLAARGFLGRMQESAKIVDELETGGYAPSYGAAYVEGMRQMPVVGSTVGALAGAAAGDKFQTYNQAQMDWVRAKLRKESGAVISPEEMKDEIRTYFPRAGEGEKVIKQKAASRRSAERAMAIQAGIDKEPAKSTPEKPAKVIKWSDL